MTPLTTMDRRWIPVVGRVLLSAIFILSGLMKFIHWNETAGYMASQGMPAVPFFLFLAAAIELLGGLSLLLGFKARAGAALLALYLIPVTLVFHRFWDFQGMDGQQQFIQFMKNLAIMGGLWTVAAFGPGSVSLDARTPRSLEDELPERRLVA
jgi:putative oxidoreductase